MKRTTPSNIIFAKGQALKQIILSLFFAVSLQGCGPGEPVRIGFITGTFGHMAEMGISARYALQLAVDQCNEKGGIHGRRVELVIRDNQHDVDAAVRDVQELIELGVDAMIGPMSSTIAMAIVPYLNQSQIVTVSPTATTTRLSGQDDYFFRVCPTADVQARVNADYQIQSGNMQRITVAFHRGNPSFCKSFIKNFRKTFQAGGGEILSVISFTSEDGRSFFQIADALLKNKPDGVLIVANAMDSAMLCQQIRKISLSVKITLSSWSASHRFIELGSWAVEGSTLPISVDWNSSHPRYKQFQKIFYTRYRLEPGIGSLNGYNAAQVVLAALETRKSGQSLKDAILSLGEFNGLQRKIKFDAYGDMNGGVFMYTIRNHQFEPLE
ncbi:ABC transporter substrate-binding protein [Desulfobacter curvatus]|uniref:ABC transporter substrate-binding protein n=1 Tax=Desulfobacter curvatus TaxID=2290 RepID=UPI00037F49BB|nr:ABC transporter substrate-binding protein [Desulfobacter curvatus]